MRLSSLAVLLDPRRLSTELERGVKMKRAFLVMVVSALASTASYVYSLTVRTKWINPFGGVLGGVYFPFTSARDVTFAGLGYVLMGLVVTMFVLAAVIYVSRPTRGFSGELVSAVLHGSFAIAIASALLLAYNASLPAREEYVVGFELRGLKLENVTFTLLQQGNVTVEGQALILRAERVVAEVRSNDNVPLGDSLRSGNFRTFVKLFDVGIRRGHEVTAIGDAELLSAEYDMIAYDSLASYSIYPPLSRDPLSVAVSAASWIWVVVYSVWVMKRLTKASNLWAISAAVVTLIALLVLGIL
jgi:hypothetical protein